MILWMGNIDILVYDYCEAKININITIITIFASIVFVLINAYKCVKLACKALQLIMIGAYNHNTTQLLLLTIIVSGKKCLISIIDKQNIMINRQNWLIAHPYMICLHNYI